jgi:predicted nucleotidyltransferase component of viral defense system
MDKYQLQSWTEKLSISPVEIIREELELVILHYLSQSNIGKSLIFKGGTALRLCYSSPRFSQDLDFNLKDSFSKQELENVLIKAGKDYPELNIAEIFNKRYTLFALLKVDSPHLKHKISIKLEISKKDYNLKKGDYSLKTASSPLSQFSPILNIYSLKRILYEKKLAVKTRSKPRDYFDLWFISQKLGKDVKLPAIKMQPSRFKGELNQLLPNHLKNWSEEILNE